MTCSGGCISGYHLEYNSTGTYSECCPTGKILSDDRLCVPETCEAGTYRSSGSNCVACAAGTYSYGETATSCSSCRDLFVGSNGGMRFTCLSCSTTGTCLTCGYNGSSSGYEMSNGKCEYVGSNSRSGSSSGSNSGSNSGSTTTRTCASEYSSKSNECKTSQGVIYCCPNPQDCDPAGIPQSCTRL